MDDTFFDGHDKLYHHAKFGEDRTTRPGCRCENVVFVFFTGRLPWQPAGIKFTQCVSGHKSAFSPCRNRKLS